VRKHCGNEVDEQVLPRTLATFVLPVPAHSWFVAILILAFFGAAWTVLIPTRNVQEPNRTHWARAPLRSPSSRRHKPVIRRKWVVFSALDVARTTAGTTRNGHVTRVRTSTAAQKTDLGEWRITRRGAAQRERRLTAFSIRVIAASKPAFGTVDQLLKLHDGVTCGKTSRLARRSPWGVPSFSVEFQK
jgi:hypothetical protein